MWDQFNSCAAFEVLDSGLLIDAHSLLKHNTRCQRANALTVGVNAQKSEQQREEKWEIRSTSDILLLGVVNRVRTSLTDRQLEGKARILLEMVRPVAVYSGEDC